MPPPILPVVIYNGRARWRAPVALRDLFGLPKSSELWRWQPDLRYHLIDAGAFCQSDLAARDGLLALWFRRQSASNAGQVATVADALRAWLARHPGFFDARKVFAELLGAVMARTGMGPQLTEDVLDMISGLLERAEQWQQQWSQQGEARLLLRQLERRFGALPDWVTDRVRAADSAALDDWGVRILDAASLVDVIGEPPA